MDHSFMVALASTIFGVVLALISFMQAMVATALQQRRWSQALVVIPWLLGAEPIYLLVVMAQQPT